MWSPSSFIRRRLSCGWAIMCFLMNSGLESLDRRAFDTTASANWFSLMVVLWRSQLVLHREVLTGFQRSGEIDWQDCNENPWASRWGINWDFHKTSSKIRWQLSLPVKSMGIQSLHLRIHQPTPDSSSARASHPPERWNWSPVIL